MDVITKKHRIVDYYNLGTVINADVNVSRKLYAWDVWQIISCQHLTAICMKSWSDKLN
jgi:hypothetical protein